MAFYKSRKPNHTDSHYGERLQGIIDLTSDHEWHTLQEIAEGIGRPGSEASVSAAFHVLRKRGYLVECDRQQYPGVSKFRVF